MRKIPDGWNVKKLGECFSFLRTSCYSRAETTDCGEVHYIHYGDIHTKYPLHISPKDIDVYVSTEQASKSDCLKTGDLILLDASEDYEGTTRCVELLNISDDEKIVSGLHTLALRDTAQNFINGFRAYITSTPFVRNNFWKQVTGIKVYGVSKDNLKKIKLLLPPLCEQEKIAEILGTWDTAIEKLTALIEQKKLLKKGLMQRLLTGKQRLPGFSTPWKKFEFDAIFYTEKGIKNKQIQTKEYQTKGRFPIVDQGKQKIIAYTDDENKLYKCTPVIVFGDHTRILKFITFHFVIGADGTQLIKTYSEYSLVFCFYVLQNISIPNLGYSRHMSVLKEKVFNLPPLPEQKAIADILSKADEEIDLLTRKLDLLQSQKKGLMQQLLTGKIRVKVA